MALQPHLGGGVERGRLEADPTRDHHSRERLETIEQLRTGIESGQLVLHYQPKVELRSGAVVGVEALVRWAHPERALLMPGAFLPLAEQTGIMHPLTIAAPYKFSVR